MKPEELKKVLEDRDKEKAREDSVRAISGVVAIVVLAVVITIALRITVFRG